MPLAETTAKADFTDGQFADVSGTRIAYHRYGSGPKIICLHATGHGARDFVKLARSLGESFEFIAVDWPGQGDSPRETEAASANRYAQILNDLVDRLGLQDYILLGNSIGGAAAIIHAAARPDQVKALVLCNPGGLQPVNMIARFYCRYMAKFFAKGARGDSGFADKFKHYYEKTILPQAAAKWRRDEIIASGYESAAVLKEAWESFARPQADIRALTPKLSMPVLYAWAKDDKAVAWSRSKKAALAAPQCKIAFFDGGHCAFLESPDAFGEHLRDFTSRLDIV